MLICQENVVFLLKLFDLLLTSSTKLTDNTFASGAISFHTVAVAIDSGRVLYRCQGNGPCVKHKDDSPTPTSEANDPVIDEVVLVRSTQRTVRAIDEASGSERWNFRFSSHFETSILGFIIHN